MKSVARMTLALWLLLAGLVSLAPSTATAQESSSGSSANATALPVGTPDAPSAALRDALSAACSQSEKEFARFLTARNLETFLRLTPAARVALMKRFVLLNEPGKASVQKNPSGRPTVRCETPAGAAEMQIGGAEVTDNLAFLPVEEREATGTIGADALHIKMGLVRENGEWKLLSVGLLLLDLPSLAAEWDAAEIESTERAAIDALKKIADAVEAYRRTYSRLPDSLSKLGPPPHGPASPESAGLLDPELASGAKNGYVLRYVIVGASALGAPAKFELSAMPQTYGRTGRRSFLRDAAGRLHGADRQGGVASEADPNVD